MRARPRFALLAATLCLACAGPESEAPPAQTAASRCGEIDRLTVAAQRDSFVLDFPDAERRLRAVLALLDEAPEAAELCAAPRGAVLAELGLALSSQRKFRLADAAFDEADAALSALDPADPAADERRRLARGRVAALRAQHALNRRDFAQAADRSAEALRLLDADAGRSGAADLGALVELGREERARQVSGLASFYARSAALARSGEPEAARGAIARALEIAGALPGVTGALRSRVLAESALVELEAGRPEAALGPAREAADQLAAELPGTPLAARARLIEAVALSRAGRAGDAFAAFDVAFAAYAENPAELQYESVWPFIRLSLESAATGAIERDAMARGVFRAAQLVRSASAASDIAQAAAELEIGSGAAADAVRDWRTAQEELLLLTTALSRRDLQDFEREALNARYVTAADAEARLRERRDSLAPDYRRAIEAPATLAEVQAALAPDEALLQILIGAPRSTVLLVEPGAIRVRTSAVNGEVAAGVTRLLRSATTPLPGARYPGFPTGVAHQVFGLLFGDLAPDVAAAPKLFVAATGALQGLPLEVLVTEDPAPQADRVARGDYGGVAWLGAGTRISYLPSPRSLIDLRRGAGESAAAAPLMAFGDFDPGPDIAARIPPRRRESCAAEIDLMRRLGRLPGTREEIKRLGAALGGDIENLTGAAFTEGAVKRLSEEGRLSGYRILHFATHGLLWPTADCFDPALTASPADDGEDALLESGEIRRLRLDAQLVVLSACQSTDVEIAEAGENLSGLSRAFFTAGARAVIASHWLADDEATAALMAAFYGRIGAERDVSFAAALRAAQAELRSAPRTSHPVFWAPFVLVGDGALSLGRA